MNDDHFFLQFVVPDGWDPTYLFDARPLEMTKNKWLQNYLGEEPLEWKGANGTSTYYSSLAKALMKFKNYFSVINGVHMATSFDGHDQNMNYFFTGNPFGGQSYLPWLSKNSQLNETSIVGIQSGSLFMDIQNHGEIIPLAGDAGNRLIRYLKSSPQQELSNPSFQFILNRLEENSQGKGSFSLATKALKKSFLKQELLYHQLKDLDLSGGEDSLISQNLYLMKNLFSKKVARTALITIRPNLDNGDSPIPLSLDTHFFDTASKQKLMYANVVEQIVAYIEGLRSIAYDNSRSLLDVTTFVITSEFSRTMRQNYTKFETTGTDHNSLNNSILIGGKGIRCGQIIGQSDFRSSDEILSPAHLQKDSNKIKFMGKAYDFKNQKISEKIPDDYKMEDYINSQSIVNSLLQLGGVPREMHLKISNSAGVAPIINQVLN